MQIIEKIRQCPETSKKKKKRSALQTTEHATDTVHSKLKPCTSSGRARSGQQESVDQEEEG